MFMGSIRGRNFVIRGIGRIKVISMSKIKNTKEIK
jgi:hypothetical protein